MSEPVASLLLVDDEELNRDMLGRRLELHGYRVTPAENGRMGAGLDRREAFDLVLLDVMMPELNGFQVLSRIRQTRLASDLPVIIVTAKNQSTDVVEGFRLGSNDYVTKPIDFPVALARISARARTAELLLALQESETRYALAAARGTNDGLWDWDLRTGQMYFSPRWKEMLGFQENEVGDGPRGVAGPAASGGCRKGHGGFREPQGRSHEAARMRVPDPEQGRGLPLDALPRAGHHRNRRQGAANGRLSDRHHDRKGSRCAHGPAESRALHGPAGHGI